MNTTRKTLIALGALLLVAILTVTTGLTESSDQQATAPDRSTAAESDDTQDVDTQDVDGQDASHPTTTGDGTSPGREGPGGQPGPDAGRPGGAPEAQEDDAAAPGEPGAAPAPRCLSARCLGLEPQNPIPRVTVDLIGPTHTGARLVRCTPRRVVDYYDFIVELEITGVNDPSGIRSVGVRGNLTMNSAGGGSYRASWSEGQRGGSTTIVITDNAGNRTTVPVQWPEASCPAPPA